MMNTTNKFTEMFERGIIVSCQAQPHEPLYRPEGGIMNLMALAAQQAGAVGIRANGIVDVTQISQTVSLPIIAIYKKHYEPKGAFVTPTMAEVDALMEISTIKAVAIDCSFAKRPFDEPLADFILAVKKKYPDIVIMADVATVEEGIYAWKLGVDAVASTLYGYTDAQGGPKPNIELVVELVKQVDLPIVAEGGIYKEEHIEQLFAAGAYACVVGGAITRPKEITTRLVEAFNNFDKKQK